MQMADHISVELHIEHISESKMFFDYHPNKQKVLSSYVMNVF